MAIGYVIRKVQLIREALDLVVELIHHAAGLDSRGIDGPFEAAAAGHCPEFGDCGHGVRARDELLQLGLRGPPAF